MEIQYSDPIPQEADLLRVPLKSLRAFRKLIGPTSMDDCRKLMAGFGKKWSHEEEEALYDLWTAVDDFVNPEGDLE